MPLWRHAASALHPPTGFDRDALATEKIAVSVAAGLGWVRRAGRFRHAPSGGVPAIVPDAGRGASQIIGAIRLISLQGYPREFDVDLRRSGRCPTGVGASFFGADECRRPMVAVAWAAGNGRCTTWRSAGRVE